MSLYREAGRRARWVPLALGLAVAAGFLAGFLTGKATEGSTSLAAAIEDLQNRVEPATDALELVVIEYRQGVNDGRIVAATEYGAAKADLERAQKAISAIRDDLLMLDQEQTQQAEAVLRELTALLDRRAPAAQVEEKAKEAEEAIRAAAGLR